MPRRIATRTLEPIYRLVLGKHPNNTICSFNFLNVRHISRFLRAQAALAPDARVVVDVGAGGSPYYDIFAGPRTKYIAVDRSAAFARDETRDIERRAGTAEHLPVEDGVADIVLCNQVLEHVEDPTRATQEAFRVLRRGGLFIGSVPHMSPVHLEPADFRRYTDIGLRRLLLEAGFEDPLVEGNGGVHTSAALLITADWMHSPRREGVPQTFHPARAFVLAPFVACVNLAGLAMDKIVPDSGRSPSNLCWSTRKPSSQIGAC